MKKIFRTTFYKGQFINKLRKITGSPHKEVIIEEFIKETDNWFNSKLCLIVENLPSYHGVEIHDFLNLEEIKSVLKENPFGEKVSEHNLIVRMKVLIQELSDKSIGKAGLKADYNEISGLITISYPH